MEQPVAERPESPSSPRSHSSTSDQPQEDSQTQIDSNIEYYYTDSDSEPEDAKDKARIAEEARNKHKEFFTKFIRATEKLRSEFAPEPIPKEAAPMQAE